MWLESFRSWSYNFFPLLSLSAIVVHFLHFFLYAANWGLVPPFLLVIKDTEHMVSGRGNNRSDGVCFINTVIRLLLLGSELSSSLCMEQGCSFLSDLLAWMPFIGSAVGHGNSWSSWKNCFQAELSSGGLLLHFLHLNFQKNSCWSDDGIALFGTPGEEWLREGALACTLQSWLFYPLLAMPLAAAAGALK